MDITPTILLLASLSVITNTAPLSDDTDGMDAVGTHVVEKRYARQSLIMFLHNCNGHNIAIDPNGTVYATTSVNDENSLLALTVTGAGLYQIHTRPGIGTRKYLTVQNGTVFGSEYESNLIVEQRPSVYRKVKDPSDRSSVLAIDPRARVYTTKQPEDFINGKCSKKKLKSFFCFIYKTDLN